MPVQTNLVTNPSFETTTAGWSTAAQPGISDSGATLTRDAGGETGQLFRLAVSTGTGSLPQGAWTEIGTFPAGTTLTFHAIVDNGPLTSLPPVTCALMDMVSGQRAVYTASATDSASTARGTLTVGAAPAPVRLMFLAPSATTFYVDMVAVQVGTGPISYFDGDTPDRAGLVHAWTGTPHASTSVAYQQPTIAAAPSWGYRTTITTHVDWGTYSVYRLDTTGTHPVRGGQGITGSTVLIDPDVPLNQPVTYLIRDAQGRSFATSGTVTISATRPVLSDPATGEHTLVTIVTWPKITFDPQSKALWPHGATAPTVVVSPEHLPQSSPTLLTITHAEEAAVTARAAPGRVLLLRPSCPGLDPAHLLITSRSTTRIGDDATEPARLHELDAQHVLPDLSLRAAGDTLADLHRAVPTTLGDIYRRWATLGAIAAANLKKGS